MKNNKAFTLVELLVVIAIIGIMAAIVMVSMSNQSKIARSSKALAQLSSAIPPLVVCWDNGLTPYPASSGGNICGSNNKYGIWPIAGSGVLTNYTYASTLTSKSSWFVSLTSDITKDDKIVCCNSLMNSCGIVIGACGLAKTW